MIKGVIFDYGGTIDSRGVHWSEVIWDGYCDSEVPVSKEEFRQSYVMAERELAKVRHILPHHNFYDLLLIKMRIELGDLVSRQVLAADYPVEPKAEAIARYCYDAARSSIEEARPTLEALYARYPMVLVSNFYGNVESVLSDFDVRKYFGTIVESAVVGVRKPDPKIFALGVEALGLKPEEVVDVLKIYQTFDPILKREPLPHSPLNDEAKLVWQRYSNEAPEVLTTTVERLKEYFKGCA